MWAKFVLGQQQPEYLGARIMLGRLSVTYQRSPTPATLAQCIDELRGLYSKLLHLPKIQDELKRLFP
jgi:hypothetical protein